MLGAPGPGWSFPGGSVVKNSPAHAEDMGSIPGWGRGRRAWQPFIVLLPGESPWTEEPGGLQPMGSQRVGRLKRLHTQHAHTHTHTCTHAPGPRYCSSWIFEGPRSSQTQPSGSAAVLSLPSAAPTALGQRGHSECRESRPLPRSFHCSQTCPS